MKISSDDYTFSDRFDVPGEHWVVRLLTGEYEDTYYAYGAVKIDENDPDNPKLSFIYQIHESKIDKKVLDSDPKFKDHIGNVLTHIIEDALKRQDYKLGERDESTDNNTKESDQ